MMPNNSIPNYLSWLLTVLLLQAGYQEPSARAGVSLDQRRKVHYEEVLPIPRLRQFGASTERAEGTGATI
jgi:hypothetical protein